MKKQLIIFSGFQLCHGKINHSTNVNRLKIKYIFFTSLDFRTLLGSYVLAGIHILPMWLYTLQKFEIGSHVGVTITAVLVCGRLICCLVEVRRSWVLVYFH